ncbi:MAG: L-fuconolactonase [Porticoccaceae bacterium]|jgi:L-fuconolactonase
MSIELKSESWLASVQENIIDPERRIIDPHHHLWRTGIVYQVEDLWRDTESGHNIEKTVFVDCSAEYRMDGPEHLKCLGETEYVLAQAKLSEAGANGEAVIAAIVSTADLTLGDAVAEVLDQHVELGEGRFRGIRLAAARDPHPESLVLPGPAQEGLYSLPSFLHGMKVLGDRGLSFDAWHYHHQNQDFLEMARAVPATQIILDHFGSPLGVGRYAGKRDEIFEQWKIDIEAISQCDNVVAKLGGLLMPDNGFGFDKRETAPGSDEFVAAQRRYFMHTIECFGPDRCMFASNFPVDKLSIAYPILYNGLKKLVADFSEDEKDAMFYGTAARIYGID